MQRSDPGWISNAPHASHPGDESPTDRTTRASLSGYRQAHAIHDQQWRKGVAKTNQLKPRQKRPHRSRCGRSNGGMGGVARYMPPTAASAASATCMSWSTLPPPTPSPPTTTWPSMIG